MNVSLLFFLFAIVICMPKDKEDKNSTICGKNAEWRECTNICGPKTCQNFLMVSPCFSLRCGQPGCLCKEGFVFLDYADHTKGCVTREVCNKLQKQTQERTT